MFFILLQEMPSAGREEQHSLMFFAIQGKSVANILENLTDMYGNHVLNNSAAWKRKRHFKEGRRIAQDLPRADMPKTMLKVTNATQVEKVVMANQSISIKEIAQRFNIAILSPHNHIPIIISYQL